MTTAWFLLTLALAAVAGIAVWSRRPTHARVLAVAALVVATPLAYGAMRVALGLPDDRTPAAGRYDVLGARIDVDVAIYVLLDGVKPHHYRLPYSVGLANALQQALDAAGSSEGNAQIEITNEGETVAHDPPVTEDAPKDGQAS